MAETPDLTPTLARRLAAVLIPTYALALLSFALPEIALDGELARIVVRVADSATWGQLPFLCIAVLLLLTYRPGPSARRRAIEAVTIVVVMAGVLGGNALLNEYVTKPAFHVPRPNIVALAEQEALGPAVPDGASFYELGDKQDRRDYLEPRLAELEQPALGPEVRAHWAHETGYSFPSGHATAAMTFAALMLSLGLGWLRGWRRHVVTVLPIWALCVVYSRPLLRVHTAVDVSVGSLVGIGLGLLAFVITRRVVDALAPE